jgi:hypothetical protein
MPKLLGAPYRRQPADRIWDNHARQVFENARRRCLGGNWIGQKKDKSGKRKAADKDRPVHHVEAKNSTLRHCGDQL